MALRLFRCHACGHRMRMSGAYCNRCYQEKPYYKRRAFMGFVIFVMFLGAAAALPLIFYV